MSITTDLTINFTKDLKVLYVEDDLELQAQTKEFYEVLFDTVIVASDGKEALEKYKLNSFDIVISDVKMPRMNGIELSSKIKEMNPNQSIIIVSAYNDTEYLLKFIEMNIRQFIQKPIDVDNMLEVLYHASKSIVNEKMVEEYRESLEHSNKELHDKNKRLESLVRILDAKILQISKENKDSISDTDLVSAKIVQSDLNELKELEIDINGASILVNLTKNINISSIHVLGSLFLNYATIISKYTVYENLSLNMKALANELNNEAQHFIDKFHETSTLLESFIYVLHMWRRKISHENFHHAIEFHPSMIYDLQTIIAIVNSTDKKIESNMEFLNV